MTKVDRKGPKMKGSTLVALLMVTVVAAGALTIASVYINASSTKTASLIGVLAVYTRGSQGPASSAGYNVTVISKNGAGTLNLTQVSGPDDLIPEHSYPLTDVVVSPYNVTMVIGGENVSLGWITTATIWSALNASYATASGVSNSNAWKDLNSSYVAASGPGAPLNQTIGQFDPSIFHLSSSYFIFIGVTIPIQPQNNIPFAVAPVTNIAPGKGDPEV